MVEETKHAEKPFYETDSENSSSDNDSEEEDNINIDYEYTQDSETYKGKKPLFVQSVIALIKLINEKGENKIINKHKMTVRDVHEVKYRGIEAEVEVSKDEEKGVATLKVWGPSKAPKGKKKYTIMCVKLSSCDEKFSKMLSRKIVKPLLDSYLKGLGWKSLVKKVLDKKEKPGQGKSKCPHCEKNFWKSYIKTHIERMHIVQCNICEKGFKTINEMENHRMCNHSQAAINIVKEVLKSKSSMLEEQKEESSTEDILGIAFPCSHCKVEFKTSL